MRNLSDEELLTKYLETKDNDLYAVLDERMRPRLHAFGIRLTKSRDDADDIVQEVLLKLMELEPRAFYPPAENFLFRMMQNLNVDWKRAQARDVLNGASSLDDFDRPKSSDDDDDDDDEYVENYLHLCEPLDGESILTESQVRAKEQQAEAMLALDDLSPCQKEAVELHHCHSMTRNEMAEMLGTTETAIKMRVERGIANLRKTLGAESKTQTASRPIRAVNALGEVMHEFSAVKDAVNAGFSSNRLYCSLNQGKPYKGLTWSYASAT